MIFAAGLGTRLRPLTNDRPKALVEVNGVSLLEMNIRRLIGFGVTDIIINTHHFADKIHDFIAKNNQFGINISLSHEVEQPLETGGGLKKAAWFFEKDTTPFIVCNADILCEIDLKAMYEAHLKSEALVTYAIQHRVTSRYVLHNKEGLMCGWLNKKTGEAIYGRASDGLEPFSFSCFHIVSPRIFDYTPEETRFGIIDWYLKICGKEKIMGYLHDNDVWCDVGKPEALAEAAAVARKIGF